MMQSKQDQLTMLSLIMSISEGETNNFQLNIIIRGIRHVIVHNATSMYNLGSVNKAEIIPFGKFLTIIE